MGASKKIYEDEKYREKNRYDDREWMDRILYTKDKVKKSSLKNGDGFGFDSQRLSLK